MEKRRVAVTGMGVVSPVGHDLKTFWRSLTHGKSGIGPLTAFDASEYPVKIAGQIHSFDTERFVSKKDQRRMDPFTVYGIAAAKLAVEHAGLNSAEEDVERIGVLVGSGIGGIHVCLEQSRVLDSKGMSRFSPFMVPQMIINIVGGYIAIEHGFKGPNFGITSACASANHCLGEALRMIQYGDADAMVAGGAEGSINELSIGGFCALRALTTDFNEEPKRASRPFDADRSGFVHAEGAGVLILEAWEHAVDRGAEIHAEITGYGRTCDAYHITAPDGAGQGAARSMELAMKDAGINGDQVDYINAHGTSTILNDAAETLAIKRAFGEERARKIPVSSTKSMTGHLLGAAGAIEAIASIMALKTGVVPPTINYETPDPDCDLDYVPNTARKTSPATALSNSLGFGGHNATICFRRV